MTKCQTFYRGKDFCGNHNTRHVFFTENVDQETVVRLLDEFLNQVLQFEREIKEGLGME